MVLDARRHEALSKRVEYALQNSPSEDNIPCLAIAVSIQAATQLTNPSASSVELQPLKLLLHLGTSIPLPVEVVFDGIVAYPEYSSALQSVVGYHIDKSKGFLSSVEETIVRPLLEALSGTKSNFKDLLQLSYMLLCLARAHSQLAGLILLQEKGLVSLQEAYRRLSLPAARKEISSIQLIQTKSFLLLLLHSIIGPLAQTEREWKLGNLKEASSSRNVPRALVDAGFAEDYGMIFLGEDEGMELSLDELKQLKQIAQEGELEAEGGVLAATGFSTPAMDEADLESRIEPIKAIFPQLPSDLLIQALAHPRFNKRPTSSGDPGVEALTDSLLSESLPSDLPQLAAILRGEEIKVDPHPAESGPVKSAFKRDNVWSSVPMDYSSLRVGKDDSQLPSLTNSIPDHIRASILRLTEQQEEEAEAERRAEREEAAARRAAKVAGGAGAGGERNKPERVRMVAFEEELDEEDELEGRQTTRGVVRDSEESDEGEDLVVGGPMEDEIDASSPVTICELAYIKDPKLFDRDANTRRTKARQDLRTLTGWADEQIEGWKIMFERDPRKEKKLERHGLAAGSAGSSSVNFLPPNNNRNPRNDDQVDQVNLGDRVVFGGHDAPRGRGGGRGGRGNERGGRGRGSHNSRGHQNAARTRGHDRKMRGGMGGGP